MEDIEMDEIKIHKVDMNPNIEIINTEKDQENEEENETNDIYENLNNKKIVLSLLAIIIDHNLIFEQEEATNDLLDLILTLKLLKK